MVDKKDILCNNNGESNSNCLEKKETFEDMNLKHDLLRGIYGYGFNNPSEIQQSAILPIVKGRDVIAQAQSGSGKTGAFTIGSLERINPNILEVQVLILSPTRELANQTFDVFRYLGEHMKVKILNLTGGSSSRDCKNSLKEGVHVVVGSPGRVIQMLDEKFLKLSYLQNLILDEADDLLSRGFLENMKKIISLIPEETRIGLFSATMPKEIVELTSNFLNEPAKILIKEEEVKVEAIKQYYISVKKEWKLEVLNNLYKCIDIAQAIIFCNSKTSAINLSEEMKKKGHQVSVMHSELNTVERNQTMNYFRKGVSRVLISTDLTARGIDVANVSIVINYDFPFQKEQYIHRIGRAGRYGKKGNAISFVLPEENDQMNSLKKIYDMEIEKLPEDLSQLSAN